MKRLLRFVISVAVVSGVACSGDDGVEPDAGISALCQEATEHSDLPWLEENVFDRSCVFSSCHQGSALRAEGLNLEPGMVEVNVVDVDSAQVSTVKLVAPGDPANSYLLMKLGRGTFPAGADTTIMPAGNAALCDEKIDAIERWINTL